MNFNGYSSLVISISPMQLDRSVVREDRLDRAKFII
jgi:hypothetical protein